METGIRGKETNQTVKNGGGAWHAVRWPLKEASGGGQFPASKWRDTKFFRSGNCP